MADELFNNENDKSDSMLNKEKEKSLTDEKMRYCKHCAYQAPDWQLFAVHVLKPSHVKKFAEAMKFKVQTDPNLMNMTCEVCNITCSGHVPWNAHLMGARHRKAKHDQEMKMKVKPAKVKLHNQKPYDRPETRLHGNIHDFERFPEPLIGLEYVTEDEIIGKTAWYNCSLCQVRFDDNLKFYHLVGQKHRSNVLTLKRPEVMKALQGSAMRRSDMTQFLANEAQKLEVEEGREKVLSKISNVQELHHCGKRLSIMGNREIFTYSSRGTRGHSSGSRGAVRDTRGLRGRGQTMSETFRYTLSYNENNYSQ